MLSLSVGCTELQDRSCREQTGDFSGGTGLAELLEGQCQITPLPAHFCKSHQIVQCLLRQICIYIYIYIYNYILDVFEDNICSKTSFKLMNAQVQDPAAMEK